MTEQATPAPDKAHAESPPAPTALKPLAQKKFGETFSARGAGSTDDIVADLDRQCALVGDHVGQMNEAEGRIGLEAIGQCAGGTAERTRRVGLAETVLEGVRPGVVTTDLNQDFPVASDDGRRHRVAVRLADLDGGLRDRQAPTTFARVDMRFRLVGVSADEAETLVGRYKDG